MYLIHYKYKKTTATPTEAKPADTTVAPTEAKPSESKESVEEVHSPDLMSAVEKAKSLDIKVIEKPTVEHKTRAEAKADEDAQIITIDKAIAKKQAMDRERNLIIEFNKVNAEETKAKMEKAGLTGPTDPSVVKVKDYYRKLVYIKNANYDILLDIQKKIEESLVSYRNVGAVYDFN